VRVELVLLELGQALGSDVGKPAELLELFNRMLDVLGVPDEDGDVFERVH
jgi:hypothetical protein